MLAALQERVAPLAQASLAARAGIRTGFYAAATALTARLARPLGEVERTYGKHAFKDAYDLHREMLARPGMADVLSKAEREDLLTLPFFIASAPFDFLRVISRIRLGKARGEVVPTDAFPYPDYYLNDFHHQANGNLSARAALTYEWQIRFLFNGANRLMRQALIDQIPEGDHLDILDVGCGTASWLTQAALQNRRHRVTGIDLSPHYLGVARMFRGKDASFVQMNAEELAAEWTDRFDAVTSIWLFHEMPKDAIERATAEIARVLKPGGRFYFMDAATPEDVPGDMPDGRETVTSISERFRDFVNEPHFRDYQQIDIKELFARHGLTFEKTIRCYASRVVLAKKEATATASA